MYDETIDWLNRTKKRKDSWAVIIWQPSFYSIVRKSESPEDNVRDSEEFTTVKLFLSDFPTFGLSDFI